MSHIILSRSFKEVDRKKGEQVPVQNVFVLTVFCTVSESPNFSHASELLSDVIYFSRLCRHTSRLCSSCQAAHLCMSLARQCAHTRNFMQLCFNQLREQRRGITPSPRVAHTLTCARALCFGKIWSPVCCHLLSAWGTPSLFSSSPQLCWGMIDLYYFL